VPATKTSATRKPQTPKTLAHAQEGGREIELAMANEWQGDDRQTLAQPCQASSRAGRRRERRSNIQSGLTMTITEMVTDSGWLSLR